MYKAENWEDIDAINTRRPEPGYYLLKIINAMDGVAQYSDEPLLKLELDIFEGEFTNYFTNVGAKVNKNILLRSNHSLRNPKSLPYFKKFILDLEASNMGYKFDFRTESLKGKKIGAYLKYYTYESKYGEKQGLTIDKFFSIGEAREQLGKQLTERIEASNTNLNNDLPFD